MQIKLKKNVHSVDFHVAQYAKIVEALKTELTEAKTKVTELETENKDLKEKVRRKMTPSSYIDKSVLF